MAKIVWNTGFIIAVQNLEIATRNYRIYRLYVKHKEPWGPEVP
jgi:hypothetical protein